MGRKPAPRLVHGSCAHQKHPGLLQAPSFRLIRVILLRIGKTRATFPLAPEHLSLAQQFLYRVTPATGAQHSTGTDTHPIRAWGALGHPSVPACSTSTGHSCPMGINLLLPPASRPCNPRIQGDDARPRCSDSLAEAFPLSPPTMSMKPAS